MSCNCNISTYSSTCCPEVPYPQISSESVPSLIDNLVYALYGTINKSIVNGRVVWDIPCDPNNSSEVEQIPREEGEGLLCYLLRLFANSLDSYGQFLRWGFSTVGQTEFTLTGAYQPDRNAYIVYVNGVVQDPISYTISSTLPRVLTRSSALTSGQTLTVVELSATAGATGLTGATGPSGGPTGATGLTGATGAASPAGGIRWAYTGDGIQTQFSIVGAISTLATAFLVAIDGVLQDPNNYSISGTTLTFSQSVPNGSEIVIISLNGIQGASGYVGSDGATGATGIQGATGPSGGATGATGATGVLPPTNFGNVWSYTGDGIQTVFAITGGLSIISAAYLVTIDGVVQKTTNYTIDNVIPRTLTMSTAVPIGSEINIISLSVA